MHVVDPLGLTIFILHDIALSIHEVDDPDIYDDVSTVIQRPAMVIETFEKGRRQLHYFRSVGWNHTLLIAVECRNHRWETVRSEKDPSSLSIAELLQRGKQLI